MFSREQKDQILNFALQAALLKVAAGGDEKEVTATVKAVVDAALAVEQHFCGVSIADRAKAL